MNKSCVLTILCIFAVSQGFDQKLIERASQKWTATEVETLTLILKDAENRNLYVQILEDKLREGLAKNIAADKVLRAIDKRKEILSNTSEKVLKADSKELRKHVHHLEEEKTRLNRALEIQARENKSDLYINRMERQIDDQRMIHKQETQIERMDESRMRQLQNEDEIERRIERRPGRR